MKSYDVTIQMQPLLQYFRLVLFVFQHFTKWNVEICWILTSANFGIERIRWYSRFFLCHHTQKICSFDVAQKRQSSTDIYHDTFTPRDNYADTEGILQLLSVWSNSLSVNIQLRPHLELFPSAICFFFPQNLEISREYHVICNGNSISHLAYKVFWSNPVPEMVT